MTSTPTTQAAVVNTSVEAQSAAQHLNRPAHRGRLVTVTVVSGILALVFMVWGIMVGSSDLSVADVLRTLAGLGEPGTEFIVFELRLPRALGALLIGLCLGMAGALTQSFSRNPLATPDIIGVTSGAAMGAVATIALGGGTYAVSSLLVGMGIPLVAIVSGLLTAALVYGLAWRSGVDSYRLILIGIGVTAAMTGLTNYLIVKAELGIAAAATQWLVGSLSGISWTSIWPVVIVLLVVTPIALTQTAALNVSQLGDELSAGLGVGVQRHRVIVLACAVIFTAIAVSAAGPIEFVAFVAPQIARVLVRSSRPPLIASAFFGALIVLVADIVGRTVLPWTVPVGIVTAIIGAPYLIWLIVRRPNKDGKA